MVLRGAACTSQCNCACSLARLFFHFSKTTSTMEQFQRNMNMNVNIPPHDQTKTEKRKKTLKITKKNNKTPRLPAAPMATSYIPFYHSYISYNPTRLQFYTPFFLHRPPFYPRKANSTRRPNCRWLRGDRHQPSRVSILKASKSRNWMDVLMGRSWEKLREHHGHI